MFKLFLWLLEEGFNSKDIIIAGISGGGTLTLSTVLALKKRNLLPSGVVCMSPAVDLNFPVVYKHLKDVRDWIDQKQLEEVQRLYLQGQNANHPLASPSMEIWMVYHHYYFRQGVVNYYSVI